MGGVLKAIPLPLRFAALGLLALVAFTLLRKLPASLFVALAIVFWALVVMTWLYDQGHLGFLKRLAPVAKGLDFMASRAAQPVSALPSKARDSTPGAEPDSDERRRIFAAAKESLSRLHGNEDAKEQIFSRLIDPARETPKDPFGTNAPGTMVLIVGPRGVGKSTVARDLANLLTGVGASRLSSIITVRPTDLRTGEFRSAIELAQMRARAARGGTLILDDADWLLTADTYGGDVSPGQDFGTALVDTLSETPRETHVIATIAPQSLSRLVEDPGHARWLGKLSRRDILLRDLDDDALVAVVRGELTSRGWSIEQGRAEQLLARQLAQLRDRKQPDFDNAIACRRVAELLIEIATEEDGDAARQRRIDLDTIRAADEEFE